MRVRLFLFSIVGAFTACTPPSDDDIASVESGLRVCAAGATTKGIDVSHWNGTIDWGRAKADGVEFAFIKATESIDFLDPMFAANWAGSAQAGVLHGAYHFFRASDDGIAQADYFVQTAGIPQPGELPLVIDLEVTDGVSAAQVAQRARDFLARVEERTGRTPIIYTGPSFFTNTLGSPPGFDRYVLWIANWGVQCPNIPSPPWNNWTFWQYSSTATVAGLTGDVDVNQFNGTLADLQGFANPTPPVPDAGPDLDVPAVDDLAESADAARQGSPQGGCACDIGSRAPAPSLFGLLLVAVFAVRRRRAPAGSRAP